MSRTIKMNQKNPIHLDLKRFNHQVNKKQNSKLRERFQKLLARAIRQTTDLDISME